jgi:hypothetical protein
VHSTNLHTTPPGRQVEPPPSHPQHMGLHTTWGATACSAAGRAVTRCGAQLRGSRQRVALTSVVMASVGADERGASKSDAGRDGVGCNVAGRKSTASDPPRGLRVRKLERGGAITLIT